jgi:hypothetical protein
MKLLLLTSFIIAHSFASGQSVDTIPKNAQGMYEYTEVVKLDSASADKLYSNAKLFIVDAFKSGKNVTQLNDDNTKTVAASGNDKIITKGFVGSAIDKRVKFRILIQCKDGRYKYTINNFEVSFLSEMVDKTFSLEDEKGFKNKYLTKKQTAELYETLANDMNTLIIDLKNHMSSHSESTQDF